MSLLRYEDGQGRSPEGAQLGRGQVGFETICLMPTIVDSLYTMHTQHSAPNLGP